MITRRQFFRPAVERTLPEWRRFAVEEIAKAFAVPPRLMRQRQPIHDALRELEAMQQAWFLASVKAFLGRWTMARQRLRHVEFIRCVIGDCGCPEEEYLFNGVDLIVHYDPDGTADAFMDWGDDGQEETTVEGMSRFAARHAVFAWAASLTTERGGRVT